MRRRDRSDADESAIDLTPMLDIVFIMLIFFIVTATFVREPGIDPERPQAETDIRKKNVAVLVAVGPNNEVYIDGREVEIRSVRPVIERLRVDNPKGPIVIQADKQADTGIVIQIMEQAKLAGAPVVTISTKED